MPETNKPPVASIKPIAEWSFDEQKIKEHFGKIEENVNKQQGKKGFNPFFWLRDTVNPLIEEYKKGTRTKELEGKILSLPEVPPLPNEGKGIEYDPAPTTQDISQAPPS